MIRSTISRPSASTCSIASVSLRLLAAKEAMDSSGIQLRDEERPRFGVVTGTGMGGAYHVRIRLFQTFRGARDAPASFYHPQDHAQCGHLANLHGVRRAGAVAHHRHRLLFLRARHRGSLPPDQVRNGRLDVDRGDGSAAYLRDDSLVGIGARPGHGQWRSQQGLPALFRSTARDW